MNSFTRVWVHMVFSTKYRAPLITADIEHKIHAHMKEQMELMGCPTLRINGMPDHVHILYLQNHRLSIADVAKQMKGNTSHWINSNKLCPSRFSWQDGVRCFSVSESLVARTKAYIDNQKRHHLKTSHAEECEQLFKNFNSAQTSHESETQ
jgi:REP element-mobilizing transposase RayT